MGFDGQHDRLGAPRRQSAAHGAVAAVQEAGGHGDDFGLHFVHRRPDVRMERIRHSVGRTGRIQQLDVLLFAAVDGAAHEARLPLGVLCRSVGLQLFEKLSLRAAAFWQHRTRRRSFSLERLPEIVLGFPELLSDHAPEGRDVLFGPRDQERRRGLAHVARRAAAKERSANGRHEPRARRHDECDSHALGHRRQRPPHAPQRLAQLGCVSSVTTMTERPRRDGERRPEPAATLPRHRSVQPRRAHVARRQARRHRRRPLLSRNFHRQRVLSFWSVGM
mmetsp:Transcript_933/g.2667  ORF Transcript_933/g.2667 Transcript_933/m.2667 type:complete len:277 (+) Transcript_933:1157-1987(+)